MESLNLVYLKNYLGCVILQTPANNRPFLHVPFDSKTIGKKWIVKRERDFSQSRHGAITNAQDAKISYS